jgi:hypothetical protein
MHIHSDAPPRSKTQRCVREPAETAIALLILTIAGFGAGLLCVVGAQ